jgi:hypothetical protein
MKRAILFAGLAILAGCSPGNEQKQHDAFISECVQATFTVPQCSFMWDSLGPYAVVNLAFAELKQRK